jgi:hypothetical protein
MTEKAETILMSTFAAMEGAHIFSAFLPSIFTIEHFRDESGTVQSIRKGEVIGATFAISLGAIISGFSDSWMPLVFSVVAAALMVSVYEQALTASGQKG